MEANLLLWVGSVVLSALFLAFSWNNYGVQSSISALIYVLEGGKKALYSFFIMFLAMPLIIIINSPLGVLAGFLLMIDFAAWSTHEDKLEMKLHCFGADAGILVGMFTLWYQYHMWYLVVLYAIFILLAIPKKFLPKIQLNNSTTWIEVAAMVVVYLGVLFGEIL